MAPFADLEQTLYLMQRYRETRDKWIQIYEILSTEIKENTEAHHA
jgi:hypothetical protein